MATIKPIRAMRYTEKAGELSTCVCPPYDIVSDGEYNALCAENPHNLIRLELPKGGEERYHNAGDLLNQWLTEGILAQEEQPGIYLYRETFTVEGKTYSFDGLVCLVELVPFAEKVVLPHEETLSKAKTDRFNLMCATGCNFSSVYSLYRDKEGTVRDIVKASEALPVLAEFTDGEGVTHTLRKIADRFRIFIVRFLDQPQLKAQCAALARAQITQDRQILPVSQLTQHAVLDHAAAALIGRSRHPAQHTVLDGNTAIVKRTGAMVAHAASLLQPTIRVFPEA